MRIGEICGVYGARIPDRIRDYQMESKEEGFKTTEYHRRTHICGGGLGFETVKSSKTFCIAVHSQDYIFVMPPPPPKDLEKRDFFKMFSCITKEPHATVSFTLDTNEFQNGSGIAASVAEFNEMKAISFLQKSLDKKSDLEYDEAIQITSKAYRLFSGNIELNDLKPFVQERNKLPSKKIDFQDANYESKRKKTKREEFRVRYNRETQIWCGGWDSQLHTQFFGFNWIAVQGKDSVCVVTQDQVGKGFLEDLSYHLEVYPLFGRKGYVGQSPQRSFMMSPFAVVSVVVGLNKVDAESCIKASTAEIEAVGFLAKQMKNVPSFTIEVTVQTAISALTRLAQRDLNKKDIQVCVLRNGNLPDKVKLPFNEIFGVNENVWVNKIVKCLLGRMKPRNHKHRRI